MKKLILLGLIAAAVYYYHDKNLVDDYSDPVYAEFRVKHLDSSLLMVGLSLMPSMEECKLRTVLFWSHVFDSNRQFKVDAEANCIKTLPDRFQRLFDNVQTTATYLSFERSGGTERSARLIIYGVPSSEAYKVCPQIIDKIRKNYKGDIRCTRGTVG